MPRLGHADAGADVVADPLYAGAALLAGEDVEANFGPVVQTLGDFDGLVFGVVGGIDAIDESLLADGGVVGMQLDHGAMRSLRLRAIDLDLVVALRVCNTCSSSEDERENRKKALQAVS